MLIALSILQLILLLVHGVLSDDLNKSRRVPRRHTEVVRTYSFNHPPSVENNDFIPVTVIYDDNEGVQEIKKNAKRRRVITENEKNKLINSTGSITLNPETRFVNHPPSQDSISVAVANDYVDEMLFKPKVRSINITESHMKISDEANAPEMVLVEHENKTSQTHKRRSQHIRKVRVSKSQLDAYVNKTEKSLRESENDSKLSQSEVRKGEIKQTRVNEQSSAIPKRQQTFEKRKHLRDHFVPIIDSENYVFSHSGDFHYSYEGGDGTKASERGELRSSNGGAGSAVEGSFSYTDKDGNDFSLTYTADENGYRPVGAHLPTPPPIPPAIQRALDLLATKTTPEPITERTKKI